MYLENHREAAGKNIQNKREFDKVVNQEPPCLETTRNYDRKKKKKSLHYHSIKKKKKMNYLLSDAVVRER